MNKRILVLASVMTGLITVSGTASAEYYGLMIGRSADLSRQPQTSVEAGAVFGDFFDADGYQYFGARVNFKASPELLLYGDVGQTEIDLGFDVDGIGFGIGAFYALDGVLASTDLAIQGSYHTVTLEDDFDGEADFTHLGINAVFSGREGLGANKNIGWYANVGYNKFEIDFGFVDDDETEIGFGGGFIVPSTSGQGEFYAGLEMVDEMTFGAGYRFFLQ